MPYNIALIISSMTGCKCIHSVKRKLGGAIFIFLFSFYIVLPNVSWTMEAEHLPENTTIIIQKKSACKDIPPVSLWICMKTEQRLFIADVRPLEKFNKLRIHGSVHMALHRLKTLSFLRNRQVVLVNEGFSRRTLEETCKDLNGRDIDVAILKGGLNAWRNEKLPLEGDLLAANAFCKVSASEALMQESDPNLLFIDISTERVDRARDLFPRYIHVSGITEKNLRDIIRCGSPGCIATEVKPEPILVLFNRNGSGYGGAKSVVKKAGIRNVFYLNGGWQAYEMYHNSMAKLNRPRKERLKTIGKCRDCASISP